MRLLIRHKAEGLNLPLNYQSIIQGIIYSHLDNSFGYSRHIHDEGTGFDSERKFKFFTFSLLYGNSRIKMSDKTITFTDEVSFQISSPDIFMIRMIARSIDENGIRYGKKLYTDAEVFISDDTIEQKSVNIRMISPVCVYSTDSLTRKTLYYSPYDAEFSEMINDNFRRKYWACYGVEPESDISIIPVRIGEKDKHVTKYKNFYITGWNGEYKLQGERKYLDFLHETGLGAKNSQGFGMFECQA